MNHYYEIKLMMKIKLKIFKQNKKNLYRKLNRAKNQFVSIFGVNHFRISSQTTLTSETLSQKRMLKLAISCGYAKTEEELSKKLFSYQYHKNKRFRTYINEVVEPFIIDDINKEAKRKEWTIERRMAVWIGMLCMGTSRNAQTNATKWLKKQHETETFCQYMTEMKKKNPEKKINTNILSTNNDEDDDIDIDNKRDDKKEVKVNNACSDFQLRKCYEEWNEMFPLLIYERVFVKSWYREPTKAIYVYLNEWIHNKGLQEFFYLSESKIVAACAAQLATLEEGKRIIYDGGYHFAFYSVDGKTFSYTQFGGGTLGLMFMPSLFHPSICFTPTLLVPTSFMEGQEDDDEAKQLAQHHKPSFELARKSGITVQLWNHPIDVVVKLNIHYMGDYKWQYKVMGVVPWNHKYGIVIGVVLVYVKDNVFIFEAFTSITLLQFYDYPFLFACQFFKLEKKNRKQLPSKFVTLLTYEVAVELYNKTIAYMKQMGWDVNDHELLLRAAEAVASSVIYHPDELAFSFANMELLHLTLRTSPIIPGYIAYYLEDKLKVTQPQIIEIFSELNVSTLLKQVISNQKTRKKGDYYSFGLIGPQCKCLTRENYKIIEGSIEYAQTERQMTELIAYLAYFEKK
eukprot:126500_1